MSSSRDLSQRLSVSPNQVEKAMSTDVALSEHADRLARALRLTQEYIGSDALPPIEGWEWFDALNAHADITGNEQWRP